MTIVHPTPYIVWSNDEIDMSDPFQRRWYLRQVLTHGRSEDITKATIIGRVRMHWRRPIAVYLGNLVQVAELISSANSDRLKFA